jgi:hypothetical protein
MPFHFQNTVVLVCLKYSTNKLELWRYLCAFRNRGKVGVLKTNDQMLKVVSKFITDVQRIVGDEPEELYNTKYVCLRTIYITLPRASAKVVHNLILPSQEIQDELKEKYDEEDLKNFWVHCTGGSTKGLQPSKVNNICKLFTL